jgi:hypothetical protein
MNITKILDGYKTYIIAILGIVFAILNIIFKWFSQDISLDVLYVALGLLGLRSAIKKNE